MNEFDDDDSWRDTIEDEGPPAPPPKPLRVVQPSGERLPDIPIDAKIHLATKAMTAALRVDPYLYQRAGELCHIIRAEETTSGATPGTPIVRACPLSYLINRVSRWSRCVKLNPKTGNYVDVPPPRETVRAVLEQGYWPDIRDLRGILETPAMRPDGTIIQEPGYDKATGYLYSPNATFPAIVDAPSHSDCVLAYSRLIEPFFDFPYVNESHRSATIAAILTLLARPAIRGSVPAWLFDASAARSGKSLQVDVISIIVSGRSASRMTYPEQDEELEKVLAAYALRGASVVNFDNVARPFGGAALDKVITAVDKVDLRRLGSTELLTVDWLAVIMASGNNVTCRGDMLQRVLSPRLETPLDNPETRTDIQHADLRAWTREHRAQLAADALTILRGYVVAGRPDTGAGKWGGFESWSRLIPHALRWVGADDPMGARRGLAGDQDPDRVIHSVLVDGWARLCEQYPESTPGITISRAIELLYPERRHGEDAPPDGFEDLREVLATACDAKPGFPPSTRRLAYSLRKFLGKPIGGRKFESISGHAGISRWLVR